MKMMAKLENFQQKQVFVIILKLLIFMAIFYLFVEKFPINVRNCSYCQKENRKKDREITAIFHIVIIGFSNNFADI